MKPSFLAGWLFDATNQYDPSFYTAGAWMMFSALMLLPLPYLLRKHNHRHADEQGDFMGLGAI